MTFMEKRRHERVETNLAVTVKYAPGAAAGTATAVRDLSPGGAFVETASSIAPGAWIEIELVLPAGRPCVGRVSASDCVDFEIADVPAPEKVSLAGIVRWRRTAGAPGVGIEFLGVEEAERRRIDQYIEHRRRRRRSSAMLRTFESHASLQRREGEGVREEE